MPKVKATDPIKVLERLLTALEQELLEAPEEEILQGAADLGMDPQMRGSAAFLGLFHPAKMQIADFFGDLGVWQEIVAESRLRAPPPAAALAPRVLADWAGGQAKAGRRIRRAVKDGESQESEQSGRLDGEAPLERLRKLPFFQGFSEVELKELLRAGTWQSRAADEELVGKYAEVIQPRGRMAVVVEGRCAVLRGGERLGILERGDCFGDSLLPGTTVRALGAVMLLELSVRALEQVPPALRHKLNQMFVRGLRTALARMRGSRSAAETDVLATDRSASRG